MSLWVAGAALLAAVAIALVITGIVLKVRQPDDESRRTRASLVATQKSALDPGSGSPVLIPSVSIDMGQNNLLMDLGEVPTGCGIPRPTGWATQIEVVGLTELGYDSYVPSKYTGKTPVPVILVAHPPGMYGRQWTEHVRLTKVAEELGAILLAPLDKDVRPWLRDLSSSKAEFERVLDHATATFCVDLGRAFGVGMSSGAQALSQFSCDQPDRFRALGLVAHWMTPHALCEGRSGPAIFMVNGLLDRVSPMEGGGGCYNMDTRLPLVATTERISRQNGCKGEPETWAVDADGDCQAYPQCDADFVACEVPNGVHGWPGSQHSVVRCIGTLSEVPDLTQFPTTALLQRFFQEQMRK